MVNITVASRTFRTGDNPIETEDFFVSCILSKHDHVNHLVILSEKYMFTTLSHFQ